MLNYTIERTKLTGKKDGLDNNKRLPAEQDRKPGGTFENDYNDDIKSVRGSVISGNEGFHK